MTLEDLTSALDRRGLKHLRRCRKETHLHRRTGGCGTLWGALRGLLASAGLSDRDATIAHFGHVWGTALWMLPSLDVAPKATEWGAEEVLIDALHHAVDAVATSAAYRLTEER